MKKKKRMIAWLLTFALLLGICGSEVSVAEAAEGQMSFTLQGSGIYEVPSTGGDVEIGLTFDASSPEEGYLWYSVQENNIVVPGYEKIQSPLMKKSDTKLTVTVPQNTTTEKKEYRVLIYGNEAMNGNPTYAWITVAAAESGSEDPDEPDVDAVLSDETSFRAKVVDEKGNPVKGVKFIADGRESSGDDSMAYALTSDEKGIIEYKLGTGDWGCVFNVYLSENEDWVTETTCSFETDGGPIKAPKIVKINDRSIAEAGEITFIVKKEGGSEEPEVLSDKTTFRAKVVDEKGNPVEGAKFIADGRESSGDESMAYALMSDKDGIIEFELNAWDWGCVFNVYPKENWGWVTETTCSFETNGSNTVAPEIVKINGISLEEIGEVKIVVKTSEKTYPLLLEETAFKAIALDHDFKPVSGVPFTVTGQGGQREKIYSDASGIVTYTINSNEGIYDNGWELTIEVDEEYTERVCDDVYTIAVSDEGKLTHVKGALASGPVDTMQTIEKINDDLKNGDGALMFIMDEPASEEIRGAFREFLDSVLEEISNYNTADYTEDSWGALTEQLRLGEELYNQSYAVDAQFADMYDEISYALKNLEPVPVNKSEINASITEAGRLNKDDYTEESWKAVEEALKEAEALSKAEKPLASAVKAAQDKLVAAMKNLEKVAMMEEQVKVASVTLSTTAYTYNGKVKKPSVIAKNTKGQTIPSSDYTVKYASGRKKVGQYAVTVTFKGAYSGKYTKTFRITPKKTSIKSLKAGKKKATVKFKKPGKEAGGCQVQYATDKKFTKGVKSAWTKSNKKTSCVIKKLKSKKVYYVRVRTYKKVKVNGKTVKVYSKWSGLKKVKAK